jgi:hypothetical protein
MDRIDRIFRIRAGLLRALVHPPPVRLLRANPVNPENPVNPVHSL